MEMKQRICKTLAWTFGIATVAGIIATIIYSKQEFWFLIMLATMFVFFSPFIGFLAWYAKIRMIQNTQEYLDRVSERTVFDNILQLLVDKKLYNLLKGYGIRYWIISPKNNVPLIGFIKIHKKKLLSIELFKNELRYYIGDKKTEDQDIEENEWIVVNYDEIKINCNLEDMLGFCLKLIC